MKVLCISIVVLLTCLLVGCADSGSKSKDIADYEYEGGDEQLNDVLSQKVGLWAKQGVECYGVVVLQDENLMPTKGKPVKARIIQIKADGLKMKSLENVNLAPKAGCSKIGLNKGDTWWETEGDLFQTEVEAEKFLISKGLLE